jgi:glutaminase
MKSANEYIWTLCWAASKGDLPEIKRLVANGIDLNESDYDGRTALHLAASNGHIDVVSYLINKGVNLAPKDNMNSTPLDDAIRSNHQDIISFINSVEENGFNFKIHSPSTLLKMSTSENLFIALDENNNGYINKHDLLNPLNQNGILIDDPRLKETADALSKYTDHQEITLEEFTNITQYNLTLIERTLKGQLALPEFNIFCEQIKQIYNEVMPNTSGANADYIPQLAKVDSEQFAVAICTVDGQRFKFGNSEAPYSVQSTCKPINYCFALSEHGEDKVHKHIGREPSGHGFNEITLDDKKRPHNPMINAGAIMSCSLIQPELTNDERFEYVLNQWKLLAGSQHEKDIGFDNAVCLSESRTSDRNRALSYFMKENKSFPENSNLDDTLSFYFQCCSIQITCAAQAAVAATLANSGSCPSTGEKLLEASSIKNCLSLMFSCGMYDYSGEFAFKVGLPAKSGVSGNLMLVIPGLMGICIWSPRLDKLGNSVRGIEFCERLVSLYNFHNFDHLLRDSMKKDPRQSKYQEKIESINNLCLAANNGDLNEIKRLHSNNISLNGEDYDGRTAMHLAATAGQDHVLNYLIQEGAEINKQDRWGNTPIIDAQRMGHTSAVALLNNNIRKISKVDQKNALLLSSFTELKTKSQQQEEEKNEKDGKSEGISKLSRSRSASF